MHTSAEIDAPRTSSLVPDEDGRDGRRTVGRAVPTRIFGTLKPEDRVRSRDRLGPCTACSGVADVAVGAMAIRTGLEAAGTTRAARVAVVADAVACVFGVAFVPVTETPGAPAADKAGAAAAARDAVATGVDATAAGAAGAAGAEPAAGATLVAAGS